MFCFGAGVERLREMVLTGMKKPMPTNSIDREAVGVIENAIFRWNRCLLRHLMSQFTESEPFCRRLVIRILIAHPYPLLA